MDVPVLAQRVKVRFLDDEALPSDAAIIEMLRTVLDRISIRVGTSDLPEAIGSIAVDAAVKALRLRGYEGSTSESASEGGSVSNSFVDDVLSAYDGDLAALRATIIAGSAGIKFFK